MQSSTEKQGDGYIKSTVSKYHAVDIRKVLPFIIVVLVLGLALLIFFTDTETPIEERKKTTDSQDQNLRSQSVEDFETKIDRELSKSDAEELAKSTPLGDRFIPKATTIPQRDAIRSALLNRSSNTSNKSIVQKFKDKELERALNSRINSYRGVKFNDETNETNSFQNSSSITENINNVSPESLRAEAQKTFKKYKNALANFDPKNPTILNEIANGTINGVDKEISHQRKTKSSLSAGTASNPAFPNGYAGSNATFFNEAPKGTKRILAGSVIPIILETKIISDYVGTVKARVAKDVYDIDKASVLIPAGSVVLAQSSRIKGGNEALNNRLAVTAPTIIRPDGLKIDLRDHNLLDQAGVSGVKDKTNYHFVSMALATVAYATTVGLSTAGFVDIVGLGDSGSNNPSPSTTGPTVPTTRVIPTRETTRVVVVDADGNETTTTTTVTGQEIITVTPQTTDSSVSVTTGSLTGDTIQAEVAGEFAKKVSDIFEPIIDKYFNLVPTITIRSGAKMNLIIEKDIYVSPWSNIYNEYN